MALSTSATVRTNYGAPLVLLPRAEAQELARAQTPPDPTNAWQWAINGTLLDEPSYGPPSLLVENEIHNAIYEIYRKPSSDTDIRPLPPRALRRWDVRVERRHHLIALAPGVVEQTLREGDAVRWIRWGPPPNWADTLAALNARLAQVHTDITVVRIVTPDVAYRLLRMEPRDGDKAWRWRDEPARTLHADGPPPLRPYADWPSVWAALQAVSAAERRAVLMWANPRLCHEHRGRTVHANAGLWMAERGDGGVIAIYEIHALADRALPDAVPAATGAFVQLSSRFRLAQIALRDDRPPASIELRPSRPVQGALRWYHTWIPDTPTPWRGDADQIRALVAGMCAHLLLGPSTTTPTPQHVVNLAEMLRSHVATDSLLNGDAAAFVVLGFDEIDRPPPGLPDSMAVEPGVIVPQHIADLRPPRVEIRIGIEPPPATTPFSTLPWRRLVMAAIVVLYRPPPAPLPTPTLVAADPRAANVNVDSLSLDGFYVPPLTTEAPAPDVPFGVVVHRLWRNRNNAHTMLQSLARQRRVSAETLVADLGRANLTQLAADYGLHRAVTGDHDAVWIPASGRALMIVPHRFEQIEVFASDRLAVAFVLWLGQCVAPPAIETVWQTMDQATKQHLAIQHQHIVSLLHGQQSARRLPVWLVHQSGSLDAAEMPILRALLLVPTDRADVTAIVEHVRTCVNAYAALIVRYDFRLRYQPPAGTAADAAAARLTIDMLEINKVLDGTTPVDGATAKNLRSLLALPIRLFPDHWTVADVYDVMKLTVPPEALCAATYQAPGANPSDAAADLYANCTDHDLVSLLALPAADPTARSALAAQAAYAAWRTVYEHQIQVAYDLPDVAGPPRTLTASAPLASTWLRAIDSIPLPVDMLRQLRAERERRIGHVRQHEERVLALHTDAACAEMSPLMTKFFKCNGWRSADVPPLIAKFFKYNGWHVAELAKAAREYIAAYGTVVRAYARFDLGGTVLAPLDRLYDKLANAIGTAAGRAIVEQRRRAVELVADPIATPSGTSAPAAETPAAPTDTPLSPFAASALTWLNGLASHPAWDDARNSIAAAIRNGAPPSSVMPDIIEKIAAVAPPPPARLPRAQQLLDRARHAILLYTGLDAGLVGDHADDLLFDENGDEKAAAHADQTFANTVHNLVDELVAAPYETPAAFDAMHAGVWRDGMYAAASDLGLFRRFADVVRQLSDQPAFADAELERQTASQQSFFRPHPREASFLSAALNTWTFADPDERRDKTALQRLAWQARLAALSTADQPAATLAWSDAEKSAMLLARKTPELLARIAVRWAMLDFTARGPEARSIVPPLILERLLLALLDAPEFYALRQRYGLDPLIDDGTSNAALLAAAWRTPGPIYAVVNADSAADALDSIGETALPLLRALKKLAADLAVDEYTLWRRVLFGWANSASVVLMQALPERAVVELALFVPAFNEQVEAALKRLDADTRTAIASVDRVALLHTCFAWFVAYLFPPTGRVFVQRQHPDGRVIYDDFAAAVVPMLLRDVYGVAAAPAIDADWQQMWTRLASGWLYGDTDTAPASALLDTEVIDHVLRQSRVLWRYTPAVYPLLPEAMAAGAVSCWQRAGDAMRDISPLSGIDRTADATHPEGRDIVYNEENNDFVPDPAYAFYEWRVGNDCFLRPEHARRTAIETAPLVPDRDPRPSPIELWPLDTPLLQWFNRWAALGWRRSPSKAAVDAERRRIRDPTAPAAAEPEPMDIRRQTTEAIVALRRGLRQRIVDALAQAKPASTPDGRDWTERGVDVVASAYALMDELAGGGDLVTYTDATYASDELRVDTIVRGIGLYRTFYERLHAAAADFFDGLPQF